MADYIQRHRNNMLRMVGKKVGDNTSKYTYILNTDDLTNAYLQFRNDLGYPLQVDSKYRRAVIYNKEGLEKKIKDMINDCIEESAKVISDIVVADIQYQLSNITMNQNGKMIVGCGGRSFNMASMLGSALGKGLVKGFFNILDDITSYDDRRRR